jgi:hypothetical protein
LHEFDGGEHREPDIQRSDLTRDRRLIDASWQRFGFTKAQLVNEGASIIASTDRLLGRSWDPERLRRWNALIANSMFGPRAAPERLAIGVQPDNCRQTASAGQI